MYNFFVGEESRRDELFFLTGADYNHMRNVLRMHPGETVLVSHGGETSLCTLVRYENDAAVVEIVEETYQNTELPVEIYLFQGLPKSDKLELVIQKAVELGVFEVIPVEMHRSIVKLDEKKKAAKRDRWQAIAESAAKQSKRSVIPHVSEVLSWKDALLKMGEMDVLLVPYENENGMRALGDTLQKIQSGMRVGILIGPEGGFEPREAGDAVRAGGVCVSLGHRILRTETAAITAVGMCMLHAEMHLSKESV